MVFRPAELIAKFLDAELRSGKKGQTEEEMEILLDKALILFRYISVCPPPLTRTHTRTHARILTPCCMPIMRSGPAYVIIVLLYMHTGAAQRRYVCANNFAWVAGQGRL